MKNELSPMMKHYLRLKEQYQDCVLFYRLGDFYEMFFEDAKKCSELLDLTLTGRECGLEERAPMCGVPYHACDQYVAKLVKMGERVAIVEQLTKPGEGKNLVERDVVRIISAGTVTEDGQILEDENNFIACVYYSDNGFGLSWIDITTGSFFTQNYVGEQKLAKLSDFLVRIMPSEIICNEQIFKIGNELPVVKQKVLPKFSLYNDKKFLDSIALNEIKTHFNVLSVSGLGLEDKKFSICSCGALLSYLRETQKHSLPNITTLRHYNDLDYMYLNATTINNLEITKTNKGSKYGSLLWLLDKTKTAMGSRKLREWVLSPLANKDKINLRLDAVAELYYNNYMREGLSDILGCVKDIERIAGKISNGNITPRDCITLQRSLEVLPSIKMMTATVNSQMISAIENKLDNFEDLTSVIRNAIEENPPLLTKNGEFIKEGFDEELDRLRSIRKNASKILEEMEISEKEKTGIKTLKIRYNKVFGYYIEVSNSFKDNVPYYYVRKQTLTTGERFITEDLKKLEEDILTSTEKAIQIELDIFDKIKVLLNNNLEKILENAKAIAVLDVLVNFACISRDYKYVKPEILDFTDRLNLVHSRHPVVEKISKGSFVPNDVFIDNDDNRTLIITGPNMAGKSTYMRQIALISIMAQVGCFVPCKSAEIPLVDKIFTRVGASDNLISDQSTFMVEMSEVAEIIMNATKNSLLILDEVGRGTSTYDGLSIAWSVVEYLTNKIQAKTLFATHYHELSELENIMEGVKNYKITIKEFNGQIVFLRKVVKGSANKSFGVEVASLAGIPEEITKRAKHILKDLEKHDLINRDFSQNDTFEEEIEENNDEIYQILSETDVNNLTPLQALKLLSELKEKING